MRAQDVACQTGGLCDQDPCHCAVRLCRLTGHTRRFSLDVSGAATSAGSRRTIRGSTPTKPDHQESWAILLFAVTYTMQTGLRSKWQVDSSSQNQKSVSHISPRSKSAADGHYIFLTFQDPANPARHDEEPRGKAGTGSDSFLRSLDQPGHRAIEIVSAVYSRIDMSLQSSGSYQASQGKAGEREGLPVALNFQPQVKWLS